MPSIDQVDGCSRCSPYFGLSRHPQHAKCTPPHVLCSQGCGEQRWGALVNLVAFYIFAIPLSLALAFHVGWGPEGLYIGMAAGPAIQMVRKAESCRPAASCAAIPCQTLRPNIYLGTRLAVWGGTCARQQPSFCGWHAMRPAPWRWRSDLVTTWPGTRFSNVPCRARHVGAGCRACQWAMRPPPPARLPGAAVQVAYTVILLRTDFTQKSKEAMCRVLKRGSSLQHLLKLLEPNTLAGAPLVRAPSHHGCSISASSSAGDLSAGSWAPSGAACLCLPCMEEGRESMDVLGSGIGGPAIGGDVAAGATQPAHVLCAATAAVQAWVQQDQAVAFMRMSGSEGSEARESPVWPYACDEAGAGAGGLEHSRDSMFW